MTTFYTGCTHFGHANIIRLADRPFADVNEMNAALVERWNAKVKPDDTVYHLGDVSWGDPAVWLSKLNGTIVPILGNHDRETQLAAWRPARYIEHRGFVLFHYPIDDWNGRWSGSIHLHCHTHAKGFRNPSFPSVDGKRPERIPTDMTCNRFNVGVDATDFAPVAYDEIIAASIA